MAAGGDRVGDYIKGGVVTLPLTRLGRHPM